MRALVLTGVRALVMLMVFGQMAEAKSCRLALVLALDVSGSVDPTEYAQQVTGLAAALDHPDIRALILNDTSAPVSLAVYEWSSRNHQYLIQPWIDLEGPAALDAAIARIQAHRKVRAGLKTALGTSLLYARSLFQQRSHCWVKTIDVSGDGANNIGVTPAQVYASGAFDQITVNALVIGDPDAAGPSPEKSDLLAYFETQVIHGAGSFAMVAQGYEDYANAMQRKLMRELQLPVMGRVEF
ncbi:MAG: DUF1194 domain-containing protein [Roseobacter sp.]